MHRVSEMSERARESERGIGESIPTVLCCVLKTLERRVFIIIYFYGFTIHIPPYFRIQRNATVLCAITKHSLEFGTVGSSVRAARGVLRIIFIMGKSHMGDIVYNKFIGLLFGAVISRISREKK